MSDLFVTRENNYNLRNFQELESSLRRTVKFGTETISYRGLQIWNLIPERLRTFETLNKFKKETKSWKCDACPCRMCKTYIHRVGLVLRIVIYFLSDIFPLVFPFLLSETSQ